MQIWSAEIKEIERLYKAVQDQLPELGKELVPLIDTSDSNIILLYSGRCLEAIITDLCECEIKKPRKTDSLKGIIDTLGREGKIPSNIKVSMQSLGSLTAFGSLTEEFDQEQVKMALINLAVIIKWYLKYKDTHAGIKVEHDGESKNEAARRLIKKLKVKFILPALLLIVLIIFFLFSSGSTLPFSERDWILITDFENLTGDPVFDKSLYTAFSLSTSQSRYINVFPRSRMLETLAKMEIRDQTTVDEKTGREMAIRQGINIFISPGIGETGNRYTISAKIIESEPGKILRSEVIYAETRDEILPALDRLSRKLRRMLGESRFNIAGLDKPLAEATTSSLEALKQYTLGTEYHAMRDYVSAKKHYETALQIDTAFTSAKAILGSLNIESFNPVTGRALIRQASRTAGKLTERERLNVLSIHALYVDLDISKSIEYTTRLSEMYPDDPVYHNNLGVYYERSKKFDEALNEYKIALGINPDIVIAFGGIIMIYLQNSVNTDSAMVWADKLISTNPQNAWGYLFRGLTYISIDSLANAESAFLKAREYDPYLLVNLYNLAHTYRLQQRYQEAIRILERIREIDKSQDGANYDLGINYLLMGKKKEADRFFSAYKKIVKEEWTKKWPNDPGIYIALATLTARLGEMDSSEIMLQKAIERDSTLHKQFSEVLCTQGRFTEALNELEKLLENGYRELWWLKMSPDWQTLHYDVRFRNLLAKYFE